MFKINLVGRLGRDANVYETTNGNKFIAFTVAVNTKNLGKDVTYWVDVRSFNPNHVKLTQYLTKGKLVQIGGDYNCSINTDKFGVARITHNVNADYISFLNLGGGSKNETQVSEAKPIEIASQVTAEIDEDTIVMNNNPSVETTNENIPVSVSSGNNGDDADDLPF